MKGEGPVHAILGATGGIGSELSRRLARGGASLLLGARDENKLGTSLKSWRERRRYVRHP